MKKSLLFCYCIFMISCMEAQEKNQFEKENQMKTYYMVFLKKGPNRNQDSLLAAQIQEQHIAYLTKMSKEGKMDIAGPFLNDMNIKGICIYNVATAEEAEKLANEDPAVKSGRLIVEVHPWYSAKGSTLK